MRLSESFMGAAGGGEATGVGVEAPAACGGVKGLRAGAGAGLEELATCARAAGGTANAATAAPIAAANMGPNRRDQRSARASQSGLSPWAQPICALTRFNRLNSAPTASGSPSLRFLFTKSHFHRMQPDSCVRVVIFAA